MINVISELLILKHSYISWMNLLVQSVQILFQIFSLRPCEAAMCFSLWCNCFVKKSLSGMLLWSLETLFCICFSYNNFIWKLVETFSLDYFLCKIDFFFFWERLNPLNSRLVFFFFFFSSFMLVSGCGIRYRLMISENIFPPLFAFLLSRPSFTISDLLKWAFPISAKFCPRRCLGFYVW